MPPAFFYCLNDRIGPLEITIYYPQRDGGLYDILRRDTVHGLYFPSALDGYSIRDAKKVIDSLPDIFSLSGFIETAAVMHSHPELLSIDQATFYTASTLEHMNVVFQVNSSSVYITLRSDEEERLSYSHFGLTALCD